MFLNQIAEYWYMAFQSAGNFSVFQAAASRALSVLPVAVWHRGIVGVGVRSPLKVHTPRAGAVFIISQQPKASSLELAVFVGVM